MERSYHLLEGARFVQWFASPPSSRAPGDAGLCRARRAFGSANRSDLSFGVMEFRIDSVPGRDEVVDAGRSWRGVIEARASGVRLSLAVRPQGERAHERRAGGGAPGDPLRAG